jgi:hemerythrin superfamily protein
MRRPPDLQEVAMSAPQTSTATDVLAFVHAQHDQIRSLFERLEAAAPAGRHDIFCELRRLLAVHETAEEEVLWPALRTAGQNGRRLADARIAEESLAKDLLATQERLDPPSDAFAAALPELRDAVLTHADQEEQEVFPVLRASQSESRLRIMQRLFALAETAAPTHPHPHGPESATGNLLLGPAVSIADRVRDILRQEHN